MPFLLFNMASCKDMKAVTSLLLLLVASTSAKTWDKNFWYKNDAAELKTALLEPNKNVAKNLVLAIGDGMGVTTTTAMRVLKGQQTPGLLGEEALLSFDTFPHVGMSKTYSTDMTTTDSAAGATAFHCGVKTKFEMVGVDDTAERHKCSTVENAKVNSVLDLALADGKSVGIITTDAVVGASPSAAYAHVAYRNWRADYELPEDAVGVCKDIARQLVEDNLGIQVILGGGRRFFLPNTTRDPEETTKFGRRLDGRDLSADWLKSQEALNRKAKYVTDMESFNKVTATNTDYLLGLFAYDRMEDETIRKVKKTEPSIAEMTEMAIRILSKNPKGFYLFIEAANIDIGHHDSLARKALTEGLAFDDAVQVVMDKTSSDDTLVVVSADHSHAFSFGGYSVRGQDIMSVANNTYDGIPHIDQTGNYYTVLSYGNGPGFVPVDKRVNLTVNPDYYDTARVYQSPFPLQYETHGGEDVMIYASGPMSYIFTGVHEQTFLAHGMSYAACLGRDKHHCDKNTSSTGATLISSYLLYLITLYLAQSI